MNNPSSIKCVVTPSSHAGLACALLLAFLGGAPPAARAQAQAAGSVEASVSDSNTFESAAEPDAAPQSPLESRLQTGLLLGGKVGGGLGKPFSEFGVTPVFELELGYALPPLHRAIEIFFTGQYTQPGIDGVTGKRDPRLPGTGLISYDLTQQELTLSLGALYRIDLGSRLVMPYAGIGGRMYMLNTKIKGSAGGQAYGKNEETQTRAGLLLLGGAELFVGPGALLAELSFGWASVNSFVLRNTNLGALNLAVGYRLMF